MKKLLLAVTCALISVSAFAVEINVVTEENPPYNYTEGGKQMGLSTEIVGAVLNEAGIKNAKINFYPWARSYKEAQDKPNTLIFAMGRTPAREDMFKWVGVVGPTKFYFFGAPGKNITMKTVDDGKKYKVGSVKDDIMELYLKEKGYEMGKNIDSVNDYEINVKKLFAGNIDLCPMPELVMNFLAKKQGKDPSKLTKSFFIEERSKDGYYMAFQKASDKALIDSVTAAYNKLKSSGKIDEIIAKHLK